MIENDTNLNHVSGDEANAEALSLEQLLLDVSVENLHEEIDSGPPVGTEIWQHNRRDYCHGR